MHSALRSSIAVLVLLLPHLAASQAEPAAPAREAVVAQLLDAFNRQDPEAMSRLVTADIQWLSISADRTSAEASSREELLKGMRSYFKSCPTCRSRHAGVISTPNRVSAVEVAEWVKDGIRHTQRSISVYEFSGSLISRVYYFPAERP